MGWAKARVLLAMIVAAGAWVLARPRRVAVGGRSMLPTLAPGDHLLVLRSRRPRLGDLVVVRAPAGQEVVKRLMATQPAGLDVRGDNSVASIDSRAWGLLPRAALRGRVVYRYAPPNRAGRLPRGRADGRASGRGW